MEGFGSVRLNLIRTTFLLLFAYGALAADVVLGTRPQGKGYVRLRETAHAPWPSLGGEGTLAAHEFHYGAVENLGPEARFAYRVERGYGITGRDDGLVTANTLASFSHRRGVGRDPRHAARMRRAAVPTHERKDSPNQRRSDFHDQQAFPSGHDRVRADVAAARLRVPP